MDASLDNALERPKKYMYARLHVHIGRCKRALSPGSSFPPGRYINPFSTSRGSSSNRVIPFLYPHSNLIRKQVRDPTRLNGRNGSSPGAITNELHSAHSIILQNSSRIEPLILSLSVFGELPCRDTFQPVSPDPFGRHARQPSALMTPARAFTCSFTRKGISPTFYFVVRPLLYFVLIRYRSLARGGEFASSRL